MADVRNTGTWQRVERGYNDMENLISRGEYNLALVKGRQTMEQIIRLCAARKPCSRMSLRDFLRRPA